MKQKQRNETKVTKHETGDRPVQGKKEELR